MRKYHKNGKYKYDHLNEEWPLDPAREGVARPGLSKSALRALTATLLSQFTKKRKIKKVKPGASGLPLDFWGW